MRFIRIINLQNKIPINPDQSMKKNTNLRQYLKKKLRKGFVLYFCVECFRVECFRVVFFYIVYFRVIYFHVVCVTYVLLNSILFHTIPVV